MPEITAPGHWMTPTTEGFGNLRAECASCLQNLLAEDWVFRITPLNGKTRFHCTQCLPAARRIIERQVHSLDLEVETLTQVQEPKRAGLQFARAAAMGGPTCPKDHEPTREWYEYGSCADCEQEESWRQEAIADSEAPPAE